MMKLYLYLCLITSCLIRFIKSIKKSLKELEKDPYKSRPNCNIKILKYTIPKKYRLRIRNHRIIYIIEAKNVKIIDYVKREVGYNRSK